MHWLAQCHAKGRQKGSAPCKNRTHVSRLLATCLNCKAMNSCQSTEKTVYDSLHIATLNPFFVCRIVIVGLLYLNTKARQNIPDFLSANLLSKHVIALDIDWSWKIFSSHNFVRILYSIFIEQQQQLIDLRKVRTENLKFRTDIGDWVMDSWMLVSSTVDDYLQ